MTEEVKEKVVYILTATINEQMVTMNFKSRALSLIVREQMRLAGYNADVSYTKKLD